MLTFYHNNQNSYDNNMEAVTLSTISHASNCLEAQILNMALPASIPPRHLMRRSEPAVSSVFSPHHSNSSSPRRSWDETLQEMSRGLQQICGSPVLSPVTTRVATPERGSPRSSAPIATYRRMSHRPDFRRAESMYGNQCRPQKRHLVVRHIETHNQLRSKLSEICKLRRDSSEQGDANDSRNSSESLQMSIPNSEVSSNCTSISDVHTASEEIPTTRIQFRCRVNISGTSVKDLIVSVREGSSLIVESMNELRKIIFETPVPEEVQINRLVCIAIDEDFIIIKERFKDGMNVEFNGTERTYLPVIHQDEDKHELMIVLHVPSGFGIGSVSVKTVDNNLIIKGNNRFSSVCAVNSSNFVFPPHGGVNKKFCFHASLSLPEGSDSRSVRGTLLENNQLIIRGRLGPASRRYSI